MPKKQDFKENSGVNPQSGSVIVWILVAVALFAALNYAVSYSSRSGGAQISSEQAKLAATEILDYGHAIRNAVQTLQINGCNDTEISFDQAIVSGYSNPNSPSDNSCHVFHPNGGGLSYQALQDDWLDGLATSQAATHYGTWYTNGGAWITGLGIDGSGSACATAVQDCRELLTGVPFIKEEICKEINKKLDWGTDSNGTPYKDTGTSYGASPSLFFDGAYDNELHMGTATPSNYSSIMAGCIEGDTSPASGTYSFFQVLIVR